ncbi:MAG: hypothetical protein ACXWRE_01935 [Pseudobdellovibrionaceae bacterium]
MAPNIIRRGHPSDLLAEQNFSWFIRYALRRFHPKSIFVDIVAMIWFTYFFWNHEWKSAVAVVIIGRVVALLLTMKIDTQAFAETFLGKMALLHLNIANMLIQIFGIIITFYGLWQHSTEFILGGVSVIFLGHLFGWEEVDPRLADRGAKK